MEGEPNLSPIPAGEDVSSLSAILLDDEYYKFTIDNSHEIDGLHLAGVCSLICLKTRAFLDLKKRKQDGEKTDSNDIKKHKNDVLRLSAVLTNEDIQALPEKLSDDLSQFIADITQNPPDGKILAKGLNMDLPLDIPAIINQLKKTFHIY